MNDETTANYNDFWNWFVANQQVFFNVVKTNNDIEKNFFNKLASQLDKINEGFHYLTGMYNENIAELIITPDGIVKNIVFTEELIKAAPQLNNWKFTALKPAITKEDISINMTGHSFSKHNLSFYANEHANYPDVVDIVVVYNNYNEKDKSLIINGICIFIDNIIGELNFVTTIDNLSIIGKEQAEKELIPIAKLKDYLIWRGKEFIEKYSGTRYNTEKDKYNCLEATFQNGKPLVAVVNSTLLEWNNKASHPWILTVEINYEGDETHGMPDNNTCELLNAFEDQIMLHLKDNEGYLNMGRQTANNLREIFFACKDFRKPAKVMHRLIDEYKGKMELGYNIYKDKYWQSMERFRP